MEVLKKQQLPLDNRLALCASFVREGTALADIGTDHAYLPIMLACEGKIRSAVASDIRTGPLQNAESNILRFGVQDKIRTVLSDGLDNVPAEEAEDIVMAGMGGELIAAIIKRTPWLYDSSRRLILQPMTRAYQLRLFLYAEGFAIAEEKACLSGKKCYSVMRCEYDGIVRECSRGYAYIGSLSEDDSEAAGQYIHTVIMKLKRKINGLRRSGDAAKAEEYETVLREIADAAPNIARYSE